MGIHHFDSVWTDDRLSSTAKLVAIALADHANDQGRAWPAVTRLVKRTSLSERSVRGALKRLEALGVIVTDRAAGPGGVNVYTFPRGAGDAPPLHEVHPPPAPAAPKPPKNHKGEPSKNLYTPEPSGAFEEFWARYPRKVGKGKARQAYSRAMKSVSHDDLMFALSQQIAALEAREPRYRPHPATWLSQERWNDEPESHGAHGAPGRQGSTAEPESMVGIAGAVARRRLRAV